MSNWYPTDSCREINCSSYAQQSILRSLSSFKIAVLFNEFRMGCVHAVEMTEHLKAITVQQVSPHLLAAPGSCRAYSTSTQTKSKTNIFSTTHDCREADDHHAISVPTESRTVATDSESLRISASPEMKPFTCENVRHKIKEGHNSPRLYLHSAVSIPDKQKAAMTATMREDLNIQLSDTEVIMPKENEVVVRIAWTGMCRSVRLFALARSLMVFEYRYLGTEWD